MPRPQIRPTDEQRRLVKTLAALGIPQEQIAMKVGIRSPKTLRKYFRDELDRGSLDANLQVLQTLYKLATDGVHLAATIFWAKSRLGWRERAAFEQSPAVPPPFIVTAEVGVQP